MMSTLHSPKDVVDRLRGEAKIVWIHIICLYKVVLFSPPPRPDIKQVTGVFFSRWGFQLWQHAPMLTPPGGGLHRNIFLVSLIFNKISSRSGILPQFPTDWLTLLMWPWWVRIPDNDANKKDDNWKGGKQWGGWGVRCGGCDAYLILKWRKLTQCHVQ